MVGFLLDYYVGKLLSTGKQARKLNKNAAGGQAAEVVLIIHCEENQSQMVEEVLWDNLSLGVGKLKTA